MDYKDTLELPSTSFPMRANLPQNEPKTYQKWKENHIYDTWQTNRQHAKESFTLHDGPPYANGHLHIGHALNKILKDIIIKFHYFQGKRVFYTPGWDCHGLPIEQQVELKIGKEKKDSLPKTTLRKLCKEHASQFIAIQSQEFQDLGVIGDFQNPYKTMDFAFEATIYKALCAIAKQGLLQERSKPIYWSWACQTALAEAEVEYEDKKSDSIYVAFTLQEDAIRALDIEAFNLPKVKCVIWTTTPWTLPANSGIALHPTQEYALSSDAKITLQSQTQKLAKLGIIKLPILKTFKASLLENKKATNPLNGKDSVFILGHHVSDKEGSGCVHTAPGHGEDDYFVALEYGLPLYMPVDDYGCYDETLIKEKLFFEPQEFVGKFVFSAHERIFELLGEDLLYHEVIVHSYPHCWRSHKPIIFRATKQWFIMMDKPFGDEGKTLREVALHAIEQTKFYPSHGLKRLYSMIENRPDWCISRQRDWGVPLAFLKHKQSGEVLFEKEVLDHIANIFQKEGCDAWWSRQVSELLPDAYQDRAQEYEKIYHILDVWFDSGSTWLAVLDNPLYQSGHYPAHLYLEGSDQHRGWFHSSLLLSCAINQKAPYLGILTHGFSMDEHGEKMSKSKGNVIAPQDTIKEFGSEILRLWVAQSDYQNDQRISKNILKQTSENYRKIRNTLRFLLANINGVDELNDEFSQIDLWILHRANEVFRIVVSWFEQYEFSKGLQELLYFISADLSGIYLDICKDNLYCNHPSWPKRLASQSAMVHITSRLFALLAPILSYTIDEALAHNNSKALLQACKITKTNYDVFDLCYEPLPSFAPKVDFSRMLELRSLFLEQIDKLKKEGIIKSTLELDLVVPQRLLDFDELNLWLMVSAIHTQKTQSLVIGHFDFEDELYYLQKSPFIKCPRCWQYLCKGADELCQRCQKVLGEK